MNRAFLIIVVPALLVSAGYLAVAARLGARLDYRRFFLAGLAFLAAVAIVHAYRRRRARPSGK